jgi:hypothetical protein
MLPAMIVLLLIGAAFVVIAWTVAEDAVDASRHKDEARAARLAASVESVLQRRWLDLSRWSEENRPLVASGRQPDLVAALREQVDPGASSTSAAWLVVREDGSVGRKRHRRRPANAWTHRSHSWHAAGQRTHEDR